MEKDKLRVTHDLTTVRRGSGTEEQEEHMKPGCRSVKANMEYGLAGVVTEIITQILGLWAKFGTRKRILLLKMDVKTRSGR